MRLMCVLLAMATLAACGDDRTERQVSTTTSTVVTTTQASTTSTTVAQTQTSSPSSEGGRAVSVGVVDEVTIVIIDPEGE